MLKKIVTPALLAATIAGAAFASGTVELTDENTAQIRTMLTEQGYEVARIKIEDGKYEAYARKGGQKYEVYLNAAFEIVEVKNDD